MQPNIPLSDLPSWAVPAIVVLVAVQLAVEIYAMIVLFRTPEERVVFQKRWPWVLIIVFVNLIGAIVFLAAGRTEPVVSDPLAGQGTDVPPTSRADRAVDVLYGPAGDPVRGDER